MIDYRLLRNIGLPASERAKEAEVHEARTNAAGDATMVGEEEDDAKKRTDGSSIVRSEYFVKYSQSVNQAIETCLNPSLSF